MWYLGFMIIGRMGTVIGAIFSVILFTLFQEIYLMPLHAQNLAWGLMAVLIVVCLFFYRGLLERMRNDRDGKATLQAA
jgi:ABC-type branched-subunit amino acid transport system permease subunit